MSDDKITKCIYKTIPETKNIIMTLVHRLNGDETFQKHVNKLQDSTKITDNKKAEMINKTIENIKVFNTKIKPLFLAKDIGILMGISQINYLIRKFEPEEKVEGYITKNNKIKKVIFLTRHGIYRCFFASRSPLAKLFRKFICNLVDHMVEHEAELMEKISEKFQLENKELIDKGMMDLQEKSEEYKVKYLEEKKKTQLLESQYDEERKKRLETEEERTEIDIINTYNMMHIQQLKNDRTKYLNKLSDIHENVMSDKKDSIDLIELKLLKEKYMKPMYIYILHPTYLKKLLKSKKREVEIQEIQNNSNNETNLSNKKEMILELLNDNVYENNFNHIFSKDEILIENDEILYFMLGFGRNIAKKDKVIYIGTEWITNKKHYNKIITSLCQNCNVLFLNKVELYKTSLDEISDVTREEFIRS